jgi:catechol 2,3-dioxygenase-like lactoylglutathione lyase family enzyme
MNQESEPKARALGINHVVLEVGDLDVALEFYGAIFAFKLRGKSDHNAFIDLGDQFIQLSLGKTQGPDDKRHFGFVVDDREAVWRALEKLGIKSINERLNFRDPWGNRIEVVPYDSIQFTKADHVLEGMGVASLNKTAEALEELRKKGMAPERSGKS